MRSFVAFSLCLLTVPLYAQSRSWNQFRGPNGEGHASAAKLPIEFGEAKNLKWKTAIDGKAWSSPVVWGKDVWLTNAPEDGLQLSAVNVDLESGQVKRTIHVFDNPKPQFVHATNSHASPTPFVEEGRLYVHFGAHGTACIDTATGEKLWERRDLECNHFRGPASSPIVFEDLLIMQFDGYDLQYVIALNKHDGRTVWKKDRAFDFQVKDGDNKKGYGTPTIFEIGGRLQMICPAAVATETFDPRTGELLWTVRHGGMNAATRTLYGHGLLYITNGMGKMVAVRPDGRGDITKTGIAWESNKGIPKKASPLLVGDLLFMVSDDGVASCVDPKTGDVHWSKRIGSAHAGSPVYASGRLYFISEKGEANVIAASKEFSLLAKNQLDGHFMASPAVAGNSLLVRSRTHLYRFEE